MSEDILERAKKALIDDDMTYEDYDECISLLITEVERLRSEVARINQIREQEMDKIAKQGGLYEQYSAAKDARIAELETLKKLEAVEADHEYQKRLEEAFLKSIVPPEGYDSECNCGICKARRKKARAALEKIKAGGSIE